MTVTDAVVLFFGHGSTCPNPYRPTDHTPWYECYAWIKPGTYRIKCIRSPEHNDMRLLLEDGGELPTRNPNRNHDGECVATDVEVHCGGIGSKNPDWRGSAACLTLAPTEYEQFIDCFTLGEDASLTITQEEVPDVPVNC